MANLIEAFDAFWAAWPKRVKRVAAQDAFRWAFAHHNADGQLLDRMLATIAWQRQFYGGPQYLPDPNKWLLECRWMDENPADVARQMAEAERAAARDAAREATRERERRYEEWQQRKVVSQ